MASQAAKRDCARGAVDDAGAKRRKAAEASESLERWGRFHTEDAVYDQLLKLMDDEERSKWELRWKNVRDEHRTGETLRLAPGVDENGLSQVLFQFDVWLGRLSDSELEEVSGSWPKDVTVWACDESQLCVHRVASSPEEFAAIVSFLRENVRVE